MLLKSCHASYFTCLVLILYSQLIHFSKTNIKLTIFIPNENRSKFAWLFLGKLVTDKNLPAIFRGKTFKGKNLPDLIWPVLSRPTHMSRFPHPMQYFAAASENDDFVIAVINFQLNQYDWKLLCYLFGFHQCFTIFLPMFHQGFTTASLVSHLCLKSVSVL